VLDRLFSGERLDAEALCDPTPHESAQDLPVSGVGSDDAFEDASGVETTMEAVGRAGGNFGPILESIACGLVVGVVELEDERIAMHGDLANG